MSKEQQLLDYLTDITSTYSPRIETKPLEDFLMAIFKGGGQKGINYAGVMKYFEEQGLITDKIKLYGGTSAGGLTAALLALGYGSEEIKKLFANDFSDMLGVYSIADAARMGIKGIPSLFNQYGLVTPEKILPMLDKKIEAMLGKKNATFRDLDIYIKNHPNTPLRHFWVVGAEVSTGHTKVFSYDTTPDLEISKAMYITMACQPIFAPLEYLGKLYGDGGISANNPMEIAKTIAKEKGIPEECLLNLRTDSPLDKTILLGETPSDEEKKALSVNNLLDYLKKLIQNVQNQDHEVLNGNQTLIVSNFNAQTFEVPITKEKIDLLFNEGYAEAKRWHTNYREGAIAYIKEHPTIYARVKQLSETEAKQRSNTLGLALEELGQYKVKLGKPSDFLIRYGKELDKTALKENEFLIFQDQKGIWKFAMKDSKDRILEQPIKNIENLDLEDFKQNISSTEYLNTLKERLYEHCEKQIQTRMNNLAREIVLIQEVHQYYPKPIIVSQKNLIEETRKNIAKKRIEGIQVKPEELKIKIEISQAKLQTLESTLNTQTIPSIEKTDESTLVNLDAKKISLLFLSSQLSALQKELRGSIRSVDYQLELLTRKNEVFQDILLYYQNGLKFSKGQESLFREQLQEIKKLLDEHQPFFSEKEQQILYGNLSILSQEAGSTETSTLETQKNEIDKLLKQSQEVQISLSDQLQPLKQQLEHATKNYHLCQSKIKQVEMLKEAVPLRKELQTLLESLDQNLQGKFGVQIEDFLCKMLHVGDRSLPQDIQSFREAKLFKHLVENLLEKLGTEGISTATVDEIITSFKTLVKQEEEKLKGMTAFFAKRPLFDCKKDFQLEGKNNSNFEKSNHSIEVS